MATPDRPARGFGHLPPPYCRRHCDSESMHELYVESGVGMAFSDGAAAWSFAADHWGVCVQARSADEAVATWTERFGPAWVTEVIHGDEQAFSRDYQEVSDHEIAITLAILEKQRHRALACLDRLDEGTLDRDDPGRVMPSWARWRTIRQMLWHICDTESRYYLPMTGLPARESATALHTELIESHRHVAGVLVDMRRDLVHHAGGEIWTSTKLLRRLAWHERGELDAIDDLLTRWRVEAPGP